MTGAVVIREADHVPEIVANVPTHVHLVGGQGTLILISCVQTYVYCAVVCVLYNVASLLCVGLLAAVPAPLLAMAEIVITLEGTTAVTIDDLLHLAEIVTGIAIETVTGKGSGRGRGIGRGSETGRGERRRETVSGGREDVAERDVDLCL